MPEHQLQKIRPVHERIAEVLLASPGMSQAEIGSVVGYTATAIGIIMRSDVFKEYLAQRRESVIDPVIAASFTDKLNAAAEASAERLLERAQLGVLADKDMVSLVEINARAKGFGARQPQTLNFLVAAPPQAKNAAEWLTTVTPAGEPSSE